MGEKGWMQRDTVKENNVYGEGVVTKVLKMDVSFHYGNLPESLHCHEWLVS